MSDIKDKLRMGGDNQFFQSKIEFIQVSRSSGTSFLWFLMLVNYFVQFEAL